MESLKSHCFGVLGLRHPVHLANNRVTAATDMPYAFISNFTMT